MEQGCINNKSESDIYILGEVLGLFKLVDKYNNKVCKKFNITQIQLEVLYLLYTSEDKELKMSVIADILQLSRSVISNLIDKMSIEALVKKRPDSSDKRIMKVIIALKGVEIIRNIFPNNEVFKTPILGFLEQGEKELLDKLLLKVSERLEKKYSEL